MKINPKIQPVYKPATKQQNKVVKKPKEEQDAEPSKVLTKLTIYV